MEYALHIQDPTDPNCLYFYEAILREVMSGSLESWRGMFAFVTGGAVKSLFLEDPDVVEFLRMGGEVSLLVGIDAVTNVAALEELSRLTEAYQGFEAKVFFNPTKGLFHPKMSLFRHEDGRIVLIVGSGNLTPKALRKNIEGYSIAIGNEDEFNSLSVWDDFLERHAENIGEIDERALEQARENQAAIRTARPKIREAVPEAEPTVDDDEDIREETEHSPDDRVLIARVPAAGGRWHQVHFNKDVVGEYFRIAPHSEQRLFLREVSEDGSLGEEEIRPVVLSKKNLNYKIEVAARRGEAYPAGGLPPILVFRELGLRNFRYMLLMPNEEGYDEMMHLTDTLPSIGRGLPRVLTTYSNLKAVWASCPL
jgi:HKD family nuclease